jgi:hypothetical protein
MRTFPINPNQNLLLNISAIYNHSYPKDAFIIIQDRRKPDRIKRIRFALFIKVLFRVIEENKIVSDQAKLIVTACIKQYRSGSHKYKSLMEAIESNLKGLVEDSVWRSAWHYTQLYQNKGRYLNKYPKKQVDGNVYRKDQDSVERELLKPSVSLKDELRDYSVGNLSLNVQKCRMFFVSRCCSRL